MKIAVGGRDPVKPNADGVPAVQSSGARKLAGLSQGSVNGVIEGTDLTAAIPVTLVPMRSFVEVELVTFSWGGPYGRDPSDLLAGHTLWGTKPFSGDALLVDTSLFSGLSWPAEPLFRRTGGGQRRLWRESLPVSLVGTARRSSLSEALTFLHHQARV